MYWAPTLTELSEDMVATGVVWAWMLAVLSPRAATSRREATLQTSWAKNSPVARIRPGRTRDEFREDPGVSCRIPTVTSIDWLHQREGHPDGLSLTAMQWTATCAMKGRYGVSSGHRLGSRFLHPLGRLGLGYRFLGGGTSSRRLHNGRCRAEGLAR